MILRGVRVKIFLAAVNLWQPRLLLKNSVEIGRGLLAEGYGSIDLALHLLGTERLLAETYSALDKS